MKLGKTWEFAVTPSGALGFRITTTDGFTVGYMLSPLSRLKISKVRAIRMAAFTQKTNWGIQSREGWQRWQPSLRG